MRIGISNLFDESSKKDAKISNPGNVQSCGALSKDKMVAGAVALGAAALYYAAPYIPTLLNGVAASSADSKLGYTNDTLLS
ncbi:MAG: hypothetical protein ACR5LA_12650 [Wolbachia sp.]